MKPLSILLAFSSLLGQSRPSQWKWFPASSESGRRTGILFEFERPCAGSPTATVAVLGNNAGKPFYLKRQIATDGEHGDTILHFEIDNLKVTQIIVECGGSQIVAQDPIPGQPYQLCAVEK